MVDFQNGSKRSGSDIRAIFTVCRRSSSSSSTRRIRIKQARRIIILQLAKRHCAGISFQRHMISELDPCSYPLVFIAVVVLAIGEKKRKS